VVLVAAAAVVLAVLVVSDAVTAASQTVSGALEPASAISLDFPQTGTVASVAVHPGEYVRPGQVLAVQSNRAALEGVVATDQAALQADKADLTQLRAAMSFAARQAAAVAALGQATPATEAAASETQATLAAEIAATQAAIARDQAQLRRDSTLASTTVLVAPQSGWVVAVNGSPGDSAGPAGVRLQLPPLVSPGSAPLTLLPSATPASGGASTGSPPMVELSTGPNLRLAVIAELPQSVVHEVGPHTVATVGVPALGGRDLRAVLSSVGTTPSVLGGQVVYPAVFALDGVFPGSLPGMSVVVHLHRLR
jgi:HlyD family secretion protein